MSRTQSTFIVLGLVLGLFCWVFADVIFEVRNFNYRDAGHFYYPLLKLVQDEWQAGRWPLWNPYENGGMPLLGNPASAVLYPPRVVLFQWLPISYATAYKWYILSHVLLSAAAAYAMARNWSASEFAAALASISYAFAAAVMFQYCNVIFLVGAAWVPLGLLAIDRMLASASWRWAIGLGVVLAMQMLGGDPEAAYVTGGLAALYLVILDLRFAVLIALAFAMNAIGHTWSGLHTILGEAIALLLVGALALAALAVLRLQPLRGEPLSPADWQLRRRRRGCLALAAVVAVGLSAVQWLPTWEFSRISLRAAGGIHHEPYAFWVAPWRFMELLWPNVSGHQFPINTRWIDHFQVGDKTWEPSLYFGSLAFVLAIASFGVRNVPAWRRWMSVTLVLSVWAATGPAGGVRWYWKMAHRAPVNAVNGSADDAPDSAVGASNPKREGPPTELENPAGGLYWLMVQLLPGFGGFRYPAKLMTFAAAAFSALAAAGWDHLFSIEGTRYRRFIAVGAALSCVLLLVALPARPHLADWFGDSPLAGGTPYFGPLQAVEASWCVVRGIATTAVALALVYGLIRFSGRPLNRDLIAAAVLALVAVDIGLANRWLVSTVTQRQLDTVPKVVQIIEAEEAAEESPGPKQPFRIHRISTWSPPRWISRVSTDQGEEVSRWEKDTIQPKYGLLKFGDSERMSYTINEGTFESYDYWWFFSPFYSNVTLEPRSIVYYPMRGFDMWGVKYFVLPHGANDKDQYRGIRTFLMHSQRMEDSESAMDEDDFQVRRNDAYFPRAWIVHRLIYKTPIRGLVKADRTNRMREILYAGFDGLWIERDLEGNVQDPRSVAWVEHPDPAYVVSLQAPAADPAADRCQIVRYEPDRVEIDVEASARGVMVLADLFFTGWELTVDGKPTEILRTNRIMRGVPIAPGKHRVEFVYNPLSFRVGGLISLFSLAAMVIALTIARLRFRRNSTQTKSSLDSVVRP